MPDQIFYSHFAEKKLHPWGEWIKRRLYRNQFRILSRHIDWNEVHTCLEIGLGRCDFFLNLPDSIRTSLRYIGIEPSPIMASRGKQLGIGVLRSFIPPFPIRSHSVDLIYMSHVIEHLSDYQVLLNTMSEIRRVLKPGGFCIMAFPDYLHYREDFYEMDYSHQYPITRYRCQTLLSDSGFKILAALYSNGCFHGLFRYLLQPFFRLQQMICQMMYHLTGRRIFFKAKILFGRNVLIITRPD
ncbi:MAG: class I SAM-dependent methyltransferase [Candidatus Delongbacteria bacterium]|nr:class I SAM-dependent methyltransferase [Candidatus Delongbacteria bacterium]